MTGKKAYESGVTCNMNHRELMERETRARRTLPALLTDQGYQTKAVGKMHFDPARACYGFEDMELPLDYMRDCNKNQILTRPKAHGVSECELAPVISTVDARDSVTTWIVDRSIDFLETRDPLRPFFLWTSFTKPHPPFDPCRDYWELYVGEELPLPVRGDWSAELETTPQGFLQGCYYNTDVHLYSERQLQMVRRAYYAMITQIDYALGRLFASLREQGLLQSTWIVFTADHGEMLGDHHMSQKSLYFEGAAHVPLLVVPPRRRKAERNRLDTHLVELGDLYPTLLDMAGIDAPEGGTGLSLLRPLPESRTFYGVCENGQFCAMEDSWKLVYSQRGGHTLLFDLQTDPMERHNLAEDPSVRELRRRLWEKLLALAAKAAPQALSGGSFLVEPPPRFPGDVAEHWRGFHYADYSVDTFH